MKRNILFVLLMLLVVVFVVGCEVETMKEPYVKEYRLDPLIVTPSETFTLVYSIRNPSESDREVFLEMEFVPRRI